ncbi:hypothetical protein O3M35_007855 [Rhynocoris fuscipes]|uniref:Uncharacterized protein n=1 Tax=Rhynocoris fuscipes TaxID=488301 RepID=A0AAW1DI43_9HEMI
MYTRKSCVGHIRLFFFHLNPFIFNTIRSTTKVLQHQKCSSLNFQSMYVEDFLIM